VNLYHPIPDSDVCDCLDYVDFSDWEIFQQSGRRILSPDWQPISVTRVKGEKRTDFPALPGSDLVVTGHAWQILQPLIGDSVEALPLSCTTGEAYFVINAIDVLDCLDYEHSEVERFSNGQVMWINSYVFKEEAIGNRSIFKLPEPGRIIVSEIFRARIEKNRLQGLIFKKIA
jgi:hypothetical protein